MYLSGTVIIYYDSKTCKLVIIVYILINVKLIIILLLNFFE